MKETKKKIENLENENYKLKNENKNYDNLIKENNKLKVIKIEKEKLDKNNFSLNENIQRLNKNNTNYFNEIQNLKKENLKLKNDLENYENNNKNLDNKNKNLTMKFENLNNQILLYKNKLEKYNQTDFILIKSNCLKFIVDIENELIDFNYFIDRRTISDLLLKVFEKNVDEKLKNFLIETIARLMKFTNEERIKINIEPLSPKHISSIQNNSDNLSCIKIYEIVKNFKNYLNNFNF